MNTSAKHFQWLLIPFLILLCLGLGGCRDEGTNRSTLRLSLQNSEAFTRSLLPKDTPLEVSRYVVEGDGPQGTTFNVISTTDTLEVEGLLIGTWNLIAVGQNTNGVDLVRGETSVNLTPQPQDITITLNSLEGQGLMNIELFWDYLKVSDPKLVVSLTNESNATQTLVPTINNIANGSVTYNGHFSAGSYLLKAQLYSGSVPVAGCAEVIRIVGNRTTEGQIELKLDKYANVPTSLTLVNNLGVPVECTILGLSENVAALTPLTATLSVSDSTEISVEWYLDGSLIGNQLSCSFTPSSGTHRLDVIAKGALLASSGSASISFTATVSGDSGVPVLVNTVQDKTSGINIGVDAHAAFLPDGKILLASNQNKTIQICRIVRESLEVMHTYTLTDGFNAEGVTDIYVDDATYRVAIADSKNPGVTIYQYDIGTSSLTKLFSRDNTYGVSRPGNFTFPYLTDLSLVRSTGILYGLNPQKDHVVQTNLYANSQNALYTLKFFWNLPSSNQPYTGMDITPTGSSVALVQKNSSRLTIFSRALFDDPFTNPQEFESPSTPYLSNVSEVVFLNDNNLVYSTNKDVGRFSKAGTWSQQEVFTSNMTGIGAMENIVQLLTNTTGTRLYVLSHSGLITFNSPSPSYELSYQATTTLGSYQPTRMDISPKEDLIVVTSDTDASLLLFRIP